MSSTAQQRIVFEIADEIKRLAPQWFEKAVITVESMAVRKQKYSYALLYSIEFVDLTSLTLRVKINNRENVSEPTKLLEEAIDDEALGQIAKREHQLSLAMKARFEDSNQSIFSVVDSLAYLPQWKAVVMVELPARNLDEILFDPKMRIGLREYRQRFKLALRGAGHWLRLFHGHLGQLSEEPFNAEDLKKEIQRKIEKIDLVTNQADGLTTLQDAFQRSIETIDGISVPLAHQHGDYYCKNVILTSDHCVAGLDFGSFTDEKYPIYLDLSNFITDLIMQKLKAKSLGFFIANKTIEEWIDIFLAGYFNGQEYDKRFLAMYCALGMLNNMFWYQEKVRTGEGLEGYLSRLYYRHWMLPRLHQTAIQFLRDCV